jgi:hypothetical protein
MRSRERAEVPASLSRLGQRFAVWRETRKTGERIPEPLWRAAVKLAATCGLNRTARFLKLDYYSLKKRLDRASSTVPSSAFVELPSSTVVSGECVIEWEDAAGSRMRIQLKGQKLPDLLALSRSFWNAD